MKKAITIILACIGLVACASLQTKTRDVLDTVSGAALTVKSFMNLIEDSVDLKQNPDALNAWIAANEQLDVALEFIEVAYDLVDQSPKTSRQYAVCALDSLDTALEYAKNAGVSIPKVVNKSVSIVRDELEDVTCGKRL